MTDTESTSNTPSEERWDGHNVITVSFAYDETAYSALTLLEELDSQHSVDVEAAVVIVRDEDGHIRETETVESGPIVGAMLDLADDEQTSSALGAISSSIKVGRTALVAVVTERSTEVVNVAMSTLGGTVLRRSVADVEAEIAAAEEAERKAKRQAR
jgi:uncharacterized membrane protein